MLGRSNPTHIYICASGGPFNISDKLLIRYQDIHKTRRASSINSFPRKALRSFLQLLGVPLSLNAGVTC